MAYAAPYIDATGFHIPSYGDILADMIAQYQAIYTSVVYLGTDTSKYQELSIFALKCYDTMLAAQIAYNARGLATAVGADLDGIATLMGGSSRKSASYSNAPATVSGVPGTIIINGYATDTSGYVWALPNEVTIPASGSVIVTVTCQTAGAIQAAANTINARSGGITAGWTGITNPSPAAPGSPVESDSQFRGRLALSTALPSITRLQATLAAVAKVVGVTRYNPGITSVANTGSSIENYTAAVDEWGNPPHSVSIVVEGGADLDVANAIFLKRGLGPLTNANAANNPNGTRTIEVTDSSGIQMAVGFQRPSYVPIVVNMTVKGLTGFSSAVQSSIQAAIVLYLNSLQIGETLTYSSLYAVAQSVIPNLSLPQFSIKSLQIGRQGGAMVTSDIVLAYYEVAQGLSNIVTVSTV